MVYPPSFRVEKNAQQIQALVCEFPFAHLFTTGDNGHLVTRLPFSVDSNEGKIIGLRAHMNAQNPQAQKLDGADVLVAFSGPDSYVSPNWRLDKSRAATWDYTAVHIWGTAHIRKERPFFDQLIVDLAAASEAKFKGLTEKPDWSLSDAPPDYVDRLFPNILAFEISISRIEGISKLHQNFTESEAMSVAEHLQRSDDVNSQKIGQMIKAERTSE